MIRKIFYIFFSTVFLALILLIFTYNVGYNINIGSGKMSLFLKAFVPQGWGFFTKDPRNEYQIYLYDEFGNRILYVNSHYSYFFGASKKGRKLYVETHMIARQIHDSLWLDITKNCEKNWIEVQDKNLYYLNDGRYLLIRYKMAPYLWRNLPGVPKKEKVYVETSTD